VNLTSTSRQRALATQHNSYMPTSGRRTYTTETTSSIFHPTTDDFLSSNYKCIL